MSRECLACSLTEGDSVPGGRVFQTKFWVIEHCVGPLGVGTLIVKAFRHCLHVSSLTGAEASELGGVLRSASACVQELTSAEQVYVCLWSHKGAAPVHIHFVVQPSWAHLAREFSDLGPAMQAEQFKANQLPPRTEIQRFCDRARCWPGWSVAQPADEGDDRPRG